MVDTDTDKKIVVKIKYGKIKLYKRSAQVCNKLCENVTIPAQSEVFVKVYMTDNGGSHLSVLEPSHRYTDRGLFIAKPLVETSHSQMTISVPKVSDKNVKLKKGSTLGAAYSVDQDSNYSYEVKSNTQSECQIKYESSELPEFEF